MEILKKFNKFGGYYEKRAVMKIGGRKYTIRAHSMAGKTWSKWKIYRKQMISILRTTDVRDWEYLKIYEFDGMVDGIVYAERKWEELTSNMREGISGGDVMWWSDCLEEKPVEYATLWFMYLQVRKRKQEKKRKRYWRKN